jgi:hypothetical protein
MCSDPAKPNGTTCSDDSACSQTDTCQTGVCTGANYINCFASDQCHDVGTCDPSTGMCSNPAKPNGTTCSDDNACSQTDTCQTGVCTGANYINCFASDQCHDVGTCNPGTGLCSNPAKPNGTTCSDDNACSQTDSCQAGVCTGGNYITCVAQDQCHDVGTCNPSTGICSNPPASCTRPVITISSPAAGTVTKANNVVVTGTVDQPVVLVTVGGVAATLTGDMFSATVPLHEGDNPIVVAARNAGDLTGTASVVVLRDTSPPRVAIVSPANGAVITGSTTTVTGTVLDQVFGGVNAGSVSVTVNGVVATVANRAFQAIGVPVANGSGNITAIATDSAGNAGTAVITVIGDTGPNAHIQIVSGNAQTGPVLSIMAQQMSVKLLDNAGAPVSNTPVTFTIVRGNGSLGGGTRVVVPSSGNGVASVTLKLGDHAGAASDLVEASAPGFIGAATFSASATADAFGPRALSVVSGANQVAAPGLAGPVPLAVRLSDSFGNALGGQQVTFTVLAGGGLVDGAASSTLTTNGDGRAFVVLATGAAVGFNSQLVEANAGSAFPVTFVASTLEPANPAVTSVSGVVLTEDMNPLANVKVAVVGSAIFALTDAQGRFQLSGVPSGRVVLDADGTSAGSYAPTSRAVELVAGVANPLDRPIYLPGVDRDGFGTANPNTAVVLERADVLGFALTIPAGSATFAGGTKTGTVQVIGVGPGNLPIAPPDGVVPRSAFSILPANVTFDPPAPIRFPNVEGYAPGAIVSIYSYDHDLGEFYVACEARVSDDGSFIASDPGQGIVKGGVLFDPPLAPIATVVDGTVPAGLTDCTAEVLNVSSFVGSDGSFAIYNVPISGGTTRVRVTCKDARGITLTSQSQEVALTPGASADAGSIDFSAPNLIPTHLAVTPLDGQILVGSVEQLAVTASYAGHTADVTAGSTGTVYRTSNPAVATVSADGLVVGVAPGTAIIFCENQGVAAFARVSVFP